MRRSASLHYHGQTFELTVPVPDGPIDRAAIAAIEQAFGREHERTYGHRAGADEPVELITILVTGYLPSQRAIVPEQLAFGAAAPPPPAPRRAYLARDAGAAARRADPGAALRTAGDRGVRCHLRGPALRQRAARRARQHRDGGFEVASVQPVAGASVLAADGVDTPALLVDLDLLDRNIARIAGACREHGIAWRPHIKGIKTPAIVQRPLAAGAAGVTCAKLSEAEVMAEAGAGDILIANQIVGPRKIARLMALRPRVDVAVAVDNAANVAELASEARRRGVELRVVIETDIGIRRAGVTSPEACLALVRRIAAEEGLCFAGVMGWEGHAAGMTDSAAKAAGVTAAVRELVAGAERCRAAGLAVAIVSCGGTGTYWLSAAQPGVTEIQAGGGVFSDVHYQVDFGVDHPCALTVVSTVTSRPNPRRIVCDAGFKTMRRDVSLPRPLGIDHVASVRLSAEHATIELTVPPATPRLGARLEFAVGYCDSTVPLHDVVYAVRRKRLQATWPILARGKLQ